MWGLSDSQGRGDSPISLCSIKRVAYACKPVWSTMQLVVYAWAIDKVCPHPDFQDGGKLVNRPTLKGDHQ